MKKNKTILLILVCLLTVCGLFGCKTIKDNKDDVKLATEEKIVSYAKKTYGKVKHISTSDTLFERVCTFEDKEYGFTFFVNSYVENAEKNGMFVGYRETKASNFIIQYCQELRMLLLSNSKYKIGLFSPVNESEFLCYVYDVDRDNIDDAIKKTVKLINKYDKRCFFTDGEVKLYDTEYLGTYYVKDKKYVSEEEYYTDIMKHYVEANVNRPGLEKQTVEFVRCERMALSQIPGIDEYEVVRKDISEDALVYVFYFKISGQEYFYANIRVWKDGSQKYYTNYKK